MDRAGAVGQGRREREPGHRGDLDAVHRGAVRAQLLTNFDASEPVYSGYGHKIVALNWGGKRDYATWFSPEPAAMLGILLIPMSPSSTYLAGDTARIETNVAEATGGKFDQKFGDYLLMYSALAGEEQRKAALATAEKLDERWIDDGNSRSYLLAWLMSVKPS
ncbi:MAG TPA: glycosyl hydrolase [Propionibacteriaceae bacterium]